MLTLNNLCASPLNISPPNHCVFVRSISLMAQRSLANVKVNPSLHKIMLKKVVMYKEVVNMIGLKSTLIQK